MLYWNCSLQVLKLLQSSNGPFHIYPYIGKLSRDIYFTLGSLRISFCKTGYLRTAPADVISSWRFKLLWTRKRSPNVIFSRSPDCKVIRLSDLSPLHPDGRKLTRPVGVNQPNIWLYCYVYNLTRSVHEQLSSLASQWIPRYNL